MVNSRYNDFLIPMIVNRGVSFQSQYIVDQEIMSMEQLLKYNYQPNSVIRIQNVSNKYKENLLNVIENFPSNCSLRIRDKFNYEKHNQCSYDILEKINSNK